MTNTKDGDMNMEDEMKKPRTIWVVLDCKWSTFRGVYLTRKEARDDNPCQDCKIVKFVEVK